MVNDRVVGLAQLAPEDLERAEQRERAEVESRLELFREGRRRVPLTGRTVVVVDDGIATGSTARAACAVARALGAARVVLAAPVCARQTARRLAADVDELVCLETPRDFRAVGQFYGDFRATEDAEVIELLGAPDRPSSRSPPPRWRPPRRAPAGSSSSVSTRSSEVNRMQLLPQETLPSRSARVSAR